MSAAPVNPIVIWFGRVGDMILLSALLSILHRRYGGRCHVIGAGSWPAELYAEHDDVARVTCLHRYTAFLFDGAWWRALAALRRGRRDPVYVCEYDPRKLARVRRLLRAGGIDPARCLFITQTACFNDAPAASVSPPPQASNAGPMHWVDRLVCFGRLTPPAFDAAAYPFPVPAPPYAPHLMVAAAARADCTAWIEARGWSGRPLVLVLNKWDRVGDSSRATELARQLERRLAFVPEPAIVHTSAKTREGLERVLPEALALYAAQDLAVPTAELNRALEDAIAKNTPPLRGKRRARFFYATQVSSRPFTILAFMNDPTLIARNYLRYLESFMRKRFGIRSAPVRVRLRGRREEDAGPDLGGSAGKTR